jgi:hypothetical protein
MGTSSTAIVSRSPEEGWCQDKSLPIAGSMTLAGLHDTRMLQRASDFRIQHKARPALGVVRVASLNLLQRHLAFHIAVQSHENLTQPAFRVLAQPPEACGDRCVPKGCGRREARRRARVGRQQ